MVASASTKTLSTVRRATPLHTTLKSREMVLSGSGLQSPQHLNDIRKIDSSDQPVVHRNVFDLCGHALSTGLQ